MRNFEKYFIIRTMAELYAYEIFVHYKEDKSYIKNLDAIYNTVFTEIPHHKFQKEIMHLGVSMAINLYQIPLLD